MKGRQKKKEDKRTLRPRTYATTYTSTTVILLQQLFFCIHYRAPRGPEPYLALLEKIPAVGVYRIMSPN